MRSIQANRPTFFQRVTGFFVPTALNAVILTTLPSVLMFDQHRLVIAPLASESSGDVAVHALQER